MLGESLILFWAAYNNIYKYVCSYYRCLVWSSFAVKGFWCMWNNVTVVMVMELQCTSTYPT